MKLKDEVLFDLKHTSNVAQFVSFSPGEPSLRHSALRSRHLPSGTRPEEAVDELFRASRSHSVNVRCFTGSRPSGNPFHYGITDSVEAVGIIRREASAGYFTLVNETLDINDGGVSGVYQGGAVEFAPGATPRAVEGTGTARLTPDYAKAVFAAVYGIDFEVPDRFPGHRVEFSLHPLRAGVHDGHTIIWEVSPSDSGVLNAPIEWPNKFSRHVGDKVFGLLIAHAQGRSVPRTRVMGRHLAPFEFGTPTTSGEVWLRTAPFERAPGRFSTQRGWTDPFKLLASEDPDHNSIASVLAQDGVDAEFSGAVAPRTDPEMPVVEGVAGFGDEFMLGRRGPEKMPLKVVESVREVYVGISEALGAVSFEWAFDGRRVWILQLHRAEVLPDGVLVAGEPEEGWIDFAPGQPLDSLHELVAMARVQRKGILVRGRVGLTSHIGDVLRRSGVPARSTA